MRDGFAALMRPNILGVPGTSVPGTSADMLAREAVATTSEAAVPAVPGKTPPQTSDDDDDDDDEASPPGKKSRM